MSGYMLEAGVQTCYADGGPVMPVVSVDLKNRKPIIKLPLLSWEIELSMYPTCCVLRRPKVSSCAVKPGCRRSSVKQQP